MTVTAKNTKIAHCSGRVLLGSFLNTVIGELFSYDNAQNAAQFLVRL